MSEQANRIQVPQRRWEQVRLKWLFQPSADANRPDEEVLSVYRDYGVIPKSSRRDNFNVTPQNLDRYLLVRPGDLVVNRMKAWQGSLGISQHRGIVSGDYEVLRPRSDDLQPRFAHHLLRSSVLVSEYRGRSTGIRPSQWRLYWEQMGNIAVPVPCVEEQRRIADFLDRETAQIDALVEKQEQLIAGLRERRVAVVSDALTAADDSFLVPLKYMLAGIDQGISPQAEARLADEPGTWGVLKTGCVNRGTFRQEEHKRLPDDFEVDQRLAVKVGDVIVSRASGTPALVGSAAIVRSVRYNLILSDKLFRLRSARDVDPQFLAWSLNGSWYRSQVHQSISGAEGLANNLPLSSLRSFKLFRPTLGDQRRIVEYLNEQTAKIDALIGKAEEFIGLARERRAALITEAVTGRIDVSTGKAREGALANG
ncbi:restriction endonuclease subunit S [Micromonospora sp. L32]|uniref:restriction endonuclease subunit S n=1 Tax=Micromonospora sp. L32 TaxID=3452214 RepID=UPI003F8A8193